MIPETIFEILFNIFLPTHIESLGYKGLSSFLVVTDNKQKTLTAVLTYISILSTVTVLKAKNAH